VLPVIRDVQERLGAAAKTAVWSGVAAATGIVVVGFLCAALFLFLERRFDAIIACLILAGVFSVLILVAATAIVVVRRRQARRARQRATQQATQWLRDPMVVTTALQAARTLGIRRAAPVLLLAAFIVGLAMSRTTKPESPEP
jgi:MFS superfamily sulfate permease-like transporter